MLPPLGVTSRLPLLLSALVLATAAGCGESVDNPTGTAGTTSVAGTASGGSAGAGVAGSTSGASVGGSLAGGGAGGAGGATGGGGAGGGGGSGGGNVMPLLLSETGLFSNIKDKTLNPDVKKFTPLTPCGATAPPSNVTSTCRRAGRSTPATWSSGSTRPASSCGKTSAATTS